MEPRPRSRRRNRDRSPARSPPTTALENASASAPPANAASWARAATARSLTPGAIMAIAASCMRPERLAARRITPISRGDLRARTPSRRSSAATNSARGSRSRSSSKTRWGRIAVPAIPMRSASAPASRSVSATWPAALVSGDRTNPGRSAGRTSSNQVVQMEVCIGSPCISQLVASIGPRSSGTTTNVSPAPASKFARYRAWPGSALLENATSAARSSARMRPRTAAIRRSYSACGNGSTIHGRRSALPYGTFAW